MDLAMKAPTAMIAIAARTDPSANAAPTATTQTPTAKMRQPFSLPMPVRVRARDVAADLLRAGILAPE